MNFKGWLSITLIAAIAVLGVSLSPGPAHAVLLSNTSVDNGAFGGGGATPAFAGAAVVAPLLSTFDFDPATAGGDGSVRSQVFTGIGAAAGLFVYVYQITHFASSSEIEVGGISFDFSTSPALTPAGAITSFFVGTAPLAPPPAGFVAGTVATTFADWTGGTLSFGGSPPVPWIGPGSVSHVFGTFSPKPPSVVIADVIDSGATITSASVYGVSEPSILLLLGSGLLGVALWSARRKRQ